MLKRPGSLRLAERIQELLRERGRSKRSLIYQLRTRHVSTGYRVLAGTTTDPWISSILEICQALDVDPDELLQVSRQPLTNELAMLLERTEQLDEEDRWLIVDLIRKPSQMMVYTYLHYRCHTAAAGSLVAKLAADHLVVVGIGNPLASATNPSRMMQASPTLESASNAGPA